ncbi:unnamed protein product [Closterium sp. NIES-54]
MATLSLARSPADIAGTSVVSADLRLLAAHLPCGDVAVCTLSSPVRPAVATTHVLYHDRADPEGADAPPHAPSYHRRVAWMCPRQQPREPCDQGQSHDRVLVHDKSKREPLVGETHSGCVNASHPCSPRAAPAASAPPLQLARRPSSPLAARLRPAPRPCSPLDASLRPACRPCGLLAAHVPPACRPYSSLAARLRPACRPCSPLATRLQPTRRPCGLRPTTPPLARRPHRATDVPDKWTPEWLRQQILQEDFRRRHTGGGAANKTAEGYGAAGGSRGRGGGRGRGRGRGFGRGRGRGDYNEGHGSSGGRGSTRMEGACWYCKKAGHPWFKCFSRPEGWVPPGMKPPSGERARGGAVQGSGAQGSGAQGKANPGMFLMVEDVNGSDGDVGSVGKVVMHPLTHWVIDSGCTSHMTRRADLLDEVKPHGKIKFVASASGALLPVIGVGNANVMGANGGLVELGNVLLVEGLSANLLSVRRLQKSKVKVTFGPTSCRANLGKLLLWDLEEKSSCIKDLWQLPIIPWNGKPPATAAAAATAKATTGGEETAGTAKATVVFVSTYGALDAVKKVQQPQQPHGEVLAGGDATAAWAKASSGNGDADWETWHERLCHINIPMLQKLVKDGSLKGLEVKGAAKKIGSCPTCLETKFMKFPFSSDTGPAKAPLALVHMDVVGPTRPPSLSGSRYFLTIVDDHTRAVWVYPLKTKGEVAAAVLKEWMPRAQRESGHKVKVIRTDNGGEFIGADFEAVLKKKGIQHQLTVPYNPQQNSVAERFNRTLQEGARTLLGCAGLPDPFWVTALQRVALVKNRVLATVGDKQWVPYTKWYGSAPAVNMLRVYGCMVVFHVPKEKRGKLEASGRWGVHLGLAKDHKGWLIWDLTRQQLTVSRDVKFLESLYYKEWKQQQQKLPTTPLIIEADEVQRPSRQVQVTVSEEEISGVTEDGGEPEWKQSVKEEYDSLLENETWELCELPPWKKAISSKLIFRHKYGPDGELTRYKSRLVAKGFQQTKGKDVNEIFAPVGKGTTLRVMLGMAANRGWKIKQMDITIAFLNGIILEELYMLQPEGLDDGSGRVCRLKKAIYGLKQAPRAWYHKLEDSLLAGGFKKSECDHGLFLLQEKEQFLMLLVYVDDILLFSESAAMIEHVEEMLEMQFKCSKMGDVKY